MDAVAAIAIKNSNGSLELRIDTDKRRSVVKWRVLGHKCQKLRQGRETYT